MKKMFAILGLIALVGLVICLLPLLTMLLWNWLMPDIFGFKQIDWWQALGLIVLGNLIFNFRAGGK